MRIAIKRDLQPCRAREEAHLVCIASPVQLKCRASSSQSTPGLGLIDAALLRAEMPELVAIAGASANMPPYWQSSLPTATPVTATAIGISSVAARSPVTCADWGRFRNPPNDRFEGNTRAPQRSGQGAQGFPDRFHA